MDMNAISQFLPIVLIFVIMYFFMIRPQQKKQKAANEMRKSLKRGDKVVTNGGIIGKVVRLKDDVVIIETGNDRVQLEVLRSVLNVTEASSAAVAAPAKKQTVKDEEEEYEEYSEDTRDVDSSSASDKK